jgi:hypothetical protein
VSYMQRAIKILRDLFVARSDAYALQQHDGTYVKIDGEISDSLFVEHLRGTKTIGLYELLEGSSVRWFCFDIDLSSEIINEEKAKGNPMDEILRAYLPSLQEQTRRLRNELERFGVQTCTEFSGSKGYHLWGFLQERMPADKIKNILHGILSNVSSDLIAHATIEIFPKQAAIRPGEYGSLVKCPLGVNMKSSKRSLFVDETFKPYERNGKYFHAQVEFLENVTKISRGTIEGLRREFGSSPVDGYEGENRFPQRDNFELVDGAVAEIYRNCARLREIKERIETTGECSEQERFTIASIFVNVPKGEDEIHRLLSHWHRYKREITQSKIDNLLEKSVRPITCRWICGCGPIRQRGGSSPVAFAYSRKSNR